MQAIETKLRETIKNNQTIFHKVSPKIRLSKLFQLKKIRDHQIFQIKKFTRKNNRYKTIIELRKKIKNFLKQINEKKQFFDRIYDFVLNVRRHRDINIDLNFKIDFFQMRNRLLITVLFIKCDYIILLTFLNDRKDESSANFLSVQMNLSINKKKCENLITESHSRNQSKNTIEGHLY